MDKRPVREVLGDFVRAWRARDVDRTLACFAEDGLYFASVGPEPGKKARGKREIRELIRTMFAVDSGATTTVSDLTIHGESANWRWRYELPDGSLEVGCDFFEFRDGRIALKDAYRKVAARDVLDGREARRGLRK